MRRPSGEPAAASTPVKAAGVPGTSQRESRRMRRSHPPAGRSGCCCSPGRSAAPSPPHLPRRSVHATEPGGDGGVSRRVVVVRGLPHLPRRDRQVLAPDTKCRTSQQPAANAHSLESCTSPIPGSLHGNRTPMPAKPDPGAFRTSGVPRHRRGQRLYLSRQHILRPDPMRCQG